MYPLEFYFKAFTYRSANQTQPLESQGGSPFGTHKLHQQRSQFYDSCMRHRMNIWLNFKELQFEWIWLSNSFCY